MEIELPKPNQQSKVSLEETLARRRSVREFRNESLTPEEVGQLLWAAQGITGGQGFRTAPSAGALYPLELYVFVGQVEKWIAGVYRYNPQKHVLTMVVEGDRRHQLAKAALGQDSVRQGPVVFLFSAVYDRTSSKYDQRGIQYVLMEVGHAAQNLCLQATALNLGGVTIGAFYDKEVLDLAGAGVNETALYIVPVGRPVALE